MRKYASILLGIILIGACIGYVVWRMDQNPELLQTYERAITGTAQDGSSANAPPPSRDALPDANDEGDSPSASIRNKTTQRVEPLKAFEIALDFANVIVGLVGIWLAISGMRMRAEAKKA